MAWVPTVLVASLASLASLAFCFFARTVVASRRAGRVGFSAGCVAVMLSLTIAALIVFADDGVVGPDYERRLKEAGTLIGISIASPLISVLAWRLADRSQKRKMPNQPPQPMPLKRHG